MRMGFNAADVPPFLWTNERLVILRTMWIADEPVSRIADALGTSRNSVIGKAHRLGLPARPSPIRATPPRPADVTRVADGERKRQERAARAEQRQRDEKAAYEARMLVQRQKEALPIISVNDAAERRMRIEQMIAAASIRRDPPEASAPVVVPDQPRPRPSPAAASVRECCWPTSNGRPWRFCCAPVAPGQRNYCAEHAERAVNRRPAVAA
jgi:GcrA cell cycle regulator